MALPCAAERQPARDTDQRQIGRQARVLEDALLKQVLEIGRVGHEQGAVKNRAVLLGFAVEQIPVPAERVDGTRILQQRQPRREQQHAQPRAVSHARRTNLRRPSSYRRPAAMQKK